MQPDPLPQPLQACLDPGRTHGQVAGSVAAEGFVEAGGGDLPGALEARILDFINIDAHLRNFGLVKSGPL
jgi:hypothetical protein